MHFEIRRGDMAYQPQRAGLTVEGRSRAEHREHHARAARRPSYVERSAAPVTRKLRREARDAARDRQVRAIVAARDGVWSGVDRMVPWVTRMAWGEEWVECRMDSISWATDMSEGDTCTTPARGRREGIVLWASRGFRPRFIRSSAPLAQEAGTIRCGVATVRGTLKLEARGCRGLRGAAHGGAPTETRRAKRSILCKSSKAASLRVIGSPRFLIATSA
jgi:hypothetical protein